MANALYVSGKTGLLKGDIDLEADNIKVALVGPGYTVNLTVHDSYSFISANVVGTPQPITGKVVASGIFFGAGTEFSGLAELLNISYIVIYKDTGVASTSTLIAYYDTSPELPAVTDGGPFTVSFPGSGVGILSI